MEDWDYEIREVEFEKLAPLAREAKREKDIAFKPTENTQWFGLYVDEELCAFAGVISVKNDFEVARLKSAFTDPIWRRQGFGDALVEHRIGWCYGYGTKEIQTISGRTRYWLARGFEPMEREYHFRLRRGDAVG